MPFLPPVMQGLSLGKAGSNLMAGNKLPTIISAIASATSQYLLTFPVINSTNNVLGPGAGTQIGTIVNLIASDMSSKMFQFASNQGLSGRDMVRIFDSISFGVTLALNSIVVQGTVVGGGPGIGFGKIVNLIPNTLTGLIMAQESFRLLAGNRIMSLTSAISFGICVHMTTLPTVNITCIGAAAPPPVGPVPVPAAPGIGRFY